MKTPRTIWSRYGYFWITLALFVLSLSGHWIFGWKAYVEEQREHGQSATFDDYAIVAIRDTLENWQSEFLQLIWQVGGLAVLLHIGSPQSKEGDDRKEAKIDAILRAVSKDADAQIQRIDREHTRR